MKESLACEWNSLDQLDGGALSAMQKKWLIDRGSLTQRLKCAFAMQLELDLVQASEADIYPDEQKMLALNSPQKQWVREIVWRTQQHALVCARVVVPIGYEAPVMQKLYQLREASVGEVLFGNHGFVRSDLVFAKVVPAHPYYAMASRVARLNVPFLWARASVFYSEYGSVLVSEIFLPNFLNQVAGMGEGIYFG